jgi:hypothetical protein
MYYGAGLTRFGWYNFSIPVAQVFGLYQNKLFFQVMFLWFQILVLTFKNVTEHTENRSEASGVYRQPNV